MVKEHPAPDSLVFNQGTQAGRRRADACDSRILTDNEQRLVGCSEWESFPGSCMGQKTLGGFGNIDDNILEIPSGTYRAVSIRSFDAKLGTWSTPRHVERRASPALTRIRNGHRMFEATDPFPDAPVEAPVSE